MDLVLVSLPEPRLHEAAADLAARHGVQVRTVATDLCRVGPELFAQVGEALKGIQASGAPSAACAAVGCSPGGCTHHPFRHAWQAPLAAVPTGRPAHRMQVGILVNCAGMFQPHPDYLEAMPDQRLQDMVTLNSLVPTMVGGRAVAALA